MPTHRLLSLLVAALTIVPAASALAAPATIDLRVEGRTRTLFEGKVTTDVRTFQFTGDSTTHTCDGTSANSGPSVTPQPTAGGAMATAAEATPFAIAGRWYAPSGGASFDTVAGESTSYDANTGDYLAEFYNGESETVGACGQPIKTGDSYVFAYGDGSQSLLALSGPTTAKPGDPVTVKVTDAADGTAVAGATVGGQTSGADGTAVIPAPAQRGITSLKASKAGDFRSNRVDVCVTDGADGFCGTVKPGQTTSGTAAPPTAIAGPDRVAAFAKIATIAEGRRFAKGRGPRTLAGRVDQDVSGVKDVRLRLSRTDGRSCSRYDGVRERLVRTARCGVKHARTFSVGSAADFSYLLPSALPRGRYVLDVIVIDRAGNQTTTYQRGRNRVVFSVA